MYHLNESTIVSYNCKAFVKAAYIVKCLNDNKNVFEAKLPITLPHREMNKLQ